MVSTETSLSAANAAHKARIGYDFAGDAAIFDAIEAGFRQSGFFTGPSNVTEAPIFITGMPRTGTTLVLVTHSRTDAYDLARRVIVLDHGRLVADDAIGLGGFAGAWRHRRNMERGWAVAKRQR